jgi:hypothetical protein
MRQRVRLWPVLYLLPKEAPTTMLDILVKAWLICKHRFQL